MGNDIPLWNDLYSYEEQDDDVKQFWENEAMKLLNGEKQQTESGTPYRNTERGKYEKNSKGIYYTTYLYFTKDQRPTAM